MSVSVAYDEETFPNVWLVTMADMDSDREWCYEMSFRRSDHYHLAYDMRNGSIRRMIGFNNIGFDYPLLHYGLKLIDGGYTGEHLAHLIFVKAQEIISSTNQWEHRIWPRDVLIEQIDLRLLHHFDNVMKMTSLKEIEFNIRSPSVEDMPFPVGMILNDSETEQLIGYGMNDTRETKRFAHKSADAIAFREELIRRGWFGNECLSWNDTKIGKEFFKRELEKESPGITKREPIKRERIHLADCIVPYVQFDRPELRDMLARLRDVHFPAWETKQAYKERMVLEGFTFDIGQGGIHGSVERRSVFASEGMVIADIDVTGYYPNLGIVNAFAPEHLGEPFTRTWRRIRDFRETAKTAGNIVEAGTLKLSNNGVFGDFGNRFSVFHDPQCLIKITINGQLLMVMLVEQLMRIPSLEVIQMNTDGLTVRLHGSRVHDLETMAAWWQACTCLKLEIKEYAAFWVRDVNNYLALEAGEQQPRRQGWEKHKGGRKRKGAYDWEMLSGSTGGQLAWNRDFSHLVVPKAAEAAFVDDIDPGDFIANHEEPYDFMIRARLRSGGRLELADGSKLPKTIRYYICQDSQPLVKVLPPLKGQANERRSGIHAEGQAACTGDRKNGYECDRCGARFGTKGEFEAHNKALHAWGVRVVNRWLPSDGLPGLAMNFYVQEAERLLF